MPRPHVRHPIFARVYAAASRSMEREIAEHRTRLLAGLSGRVVEVGAGNGMNFTHYPREITAVVAVEPEPYLRQLAEREAARCAVTVDVIDGVAEQLPLEDAGFDGGVASLVLCSVRNPASALAELFRVIRPGGQLRFYEHVRASSPRHRRFQRAVDATFWPFFAGGCHAHRDTGAAIVDAGFTVDRQDSLRVPDIRLPLPTSPHILGSATRPASD
jgi:SAM-dependent methyltransferase